MSTATQPAPVPTVDRSTELVNRLLKLPEETRLDLARLLTDSVRQGFTSLEQAAQRDKDLIRSRLDQLVKGEVELLDADDVVAELVQRYAKETSLEESVKRDKELIRSRVEAFERGEMKATDWRESLAQVEQQLV